MLLDHGPQRQQLQVPDLRPHERLLVAMAKGHVTEVLAQTNDALGLK
jgi:hypothetical protein